MVLVIDIICRGHSLTSLQRDFSHAHKVLQQITAQIQGSGPDSTTDSVSWEIQITNPYDLNLLLYDLIVCICNPFIG